MRSLEEYGLDSGFKADGCGLWLWSHYSMQTIFVAYLFPVFKSSFIKSELWLTVQWQ